MPRGVKIRDVTLGSGDQAQRGRTVIVNVRTFLNRGTEITGSVGNGQKMRINLGRRDSIAGLRYGIEGMRVGGLRDLVISPHLAYGTEGVPGQIPPNAILRCEVELLEVREPGVFKPEDFPPGRHLYVFHPGEAARSSPRWQFGLEEDGRCGVLITSPIQGLPWRYTRCKSINFQLDNEVAIAIFQNVASLPNHFPSDCLAQDDLWADMGERGNSITRDKQSDSLCITIGIMERGQWTCYFSMPENSSSLLNSELYKTIERLIQPHLLRDAKQEPSSL